MSQDLAIARERRDYQSLRLQEVDEDAFLRKGFIRRIGNVRSFEFRATLSGLGRWTDIIKPQRVALRIHNDIETALTTAGFHNLPLLETTIDPERLSFRYRDTDFEFDLDFHGNGVVILRRIGSTMETFHRWYTAFMPTVPDIMRKAIAAFNVELHRVLHGTGSGRDEPNESEEILQRVRLLDGSFQFEVTCHRFYRLGDPDKDSKPPERNLDVMYENIAIAFPDEMGRIRKNVSPNDRLHNVDNYGRMDYRVSLGHPKLPGVTQFMEVFAPSNSNWTGLFFVLTYSGANYGETRDRIRVPMNTDFFLRPEACADAYVSFFLDMGLEGFVQSVLDGYDFATTAGSLA